MFGSVFRSAFLGTWLLMEKHKSVGLTGPSGLCAFIHYFKHNCKVKLKTVVC